jgi:uncharacterized protein involved in exopolysaccharide biosynthesis
MDSPTVPAAEKFLHFDQHVPIRRSRVTELRAAAKELAIANFKSRLDAAELDTAGMSRAHAALVRRNRSKRRCAFIAREAGRIYRGLLEDEVRESSAVCRILGAHVSDVREWNDSVRAVVGSLMTLQVPTEQMSPQLDAARDHADNPIEPEPRELTAEEENEELLRQLLAGIDPDPSVAHRLERGQLLSEDFWT